MFAGTIAERAVHLAKLIKVDPPQVGLLDLAIPKTDRTIAFVVPAASVTQGAFDIAVGGDKLFADTPCLPQPLGDRSDAGLQFCEVGDNSRVRRPFRTFI